MLYIVLTSRNARSFGRFVVFSGLFEANEIVSEYAKTDYFLTWLRQPLLLAVPLDTLAMDLLLHPKVRDQQ